MTDTAELTLTTLPLANLAAHPDNIRKRLGDLDELSKSIAGVGILEPLLVLPADDKGVHLVAAGNRRLAAAAKAGLAEAPCIVRDLTEAEVIEAMLVENLQRNDVTPIEEAKAYGRLVELDTTAAAIAKKVGRSQAHVKGRLALLSLPDAVLAAVDAGKMTLETAAELRPFADDEEAMTWLAGEIKKGERLGNVAWQVDRHIAARETAAAITAATEKATAAGQTVWQPELDQYGRSKLQTSSWDSLKLNVAATLDRLELTAQQKRSHAKEPCAAVHIAGHSGKAEVTHICTNPKRHTKSAPAAERSKLQMKATVYAKKSSSGRATPAPKLRKAMLTARAEHLAGIVAKPIDLGDDLLTLVLVALESSAGEAQKFAGHIVAPGTEGDAGYSAFSTFAKDPANLRAAIVALVVSKLRTLDYNREAQGRLAEYLLATGYTPVDGEQVWIDKAIGEWEKEQRRS